MGERWVAMLRAINVGTANRVTSARLTEIVALSGARDISTHLQSGNLFFEATGTRELVVAALEEQLVAAGMKRADAMVRTAAELRALVDRHPFAGLDPEAHRCSVTFLRRPVESMPLDRLTAAGLDVRFVDDLHVCVASSRDAAASAGTAGGFIEKAWKASGTTRWWNVVEDITARAEVLER